MRTEMYNKKWKNGKKVEQGNDDYIEVKMTSRQKEILKNYLQGREISAFVRRLILEEISNKAKAANVALNMQSASSSLH